MNIYYIKKLLLSLPRYVKRALVISIDAIACVFAAWLAFGLGLGQWGYPEGIQWWVYGLALSLYIPLFFLFGFYRTIFRYVGSFAFITIARTFVIYGCFFFGIFGIIGVDGVPRSIGVIQPSLFFIAIGLTRFFISNLLNIASDNKDTNIRARPRALIYGAGAVGRQLLSSFLAEKEILVKAFVDDDPELQGSTINGLTVYSFVELKECITRYKITDVILAIPSVTQCRRKEIVSSLTGCRVRVRTLPGIGDIVFGRIRISDLHELNIADLLGREVVPPQSELMEKNIRGKVVLVTGAGGSIGCELCRQIIKNYPITLILFESSEHALYLIYEELKNYIFNRATKFLEMPNENQKSFLCSNPEVKLIPCLGSVQDYDLLLQVFKIHKPYAVFHTAAYKHVPLVELNPTEGISNNVFGTLNCAKISLECGVQNFTLISTDKAVRPSNVMGVTKRIAELVLQALADATIKDDRKTIFSMVRFGNVLGSSGSVMPLFSSQIASGGPITLTDYEVTRYFMSIPEAAQLVIQSSAMAQGGDVFVLDMGEPIRIYDLAVKMISLSGLLLKDKNNPDGDIEIEVTGLRSGEKLHEELLIGRNPQPSVHPKIMKANEEFLPWDVLQGDLEKLKDILCKGDVKSIKNMLIKLVPNCKLNDYS